MNFLYSLSDFYRSLCFSLETEIRN